MFANAENKAMSPRIRVDPSREIVLGASQRWQSTGSRERVSALFFQTGAALSERCLWLCAIHESLCDPLAFLQIHPRRHRGQASALQFGLAERSFSEESPAATAGVLLTGAGF